MPATAGLAFVAGAASLMSLCSGGLLYARAHGQRKALQGRIDWVTGTFSSTGSERTTRTRKQSSNQGHYLLAFLARAIGCRPAEPFLYPMRWWLVCCVAIAPARLIVWLLATVLDGAAMFALPLAWVFVCRGMFGWMEARYTHRVLVQFADALDMITRAVRAGIPVNVAVQSVADEAPPETAREFRRGAEKLMLGSSLEDAVAEMARHSRIPEYRFFATALSLQAQTGGGLSETLEGLAEVIRKRVAMRARGDALAGEAKTSAGILTALPIFTGGALLVISPAYAALLFDDPGGRKLLALSAGLLMFGVLMMRHIIKKSLS